MAAHGFPDESFHIVVPFPRQMLTGMSHGSLLKNINIRLLVCKGSTKKSILTQRGFLCTQVLCNTKIFFYFFCRGCSREGAGLIVMTHTILQIQIHVFCALLCAL